MNVAEVLKKRISTRAFLDKQAPLERVREILNLARWAPSGGNLQPWRIVAVAGAERQAVSDLAKRALLANPAGEAEEHPVYPAALGEVHRARRRKVAADMYALAGIAWDDKPARLAWVARNFEFFGAPVGLFIITGREMGRSQWAHLGMLMQSIALAAEELGLASCMQECWASVRKSLHAHFALEEDEILYCGMALGYADPDAPVNRLRTERASVDEIATFKGF